MPDSSLDSWRGTELAIFNNIQMSYDLDALVNLCQKLGMRCTRTKPHELEVSIVDGMDLIFTNYLAENDTMMGFNGTPWHTHGELMLMTGESTYLELDELAVISGIKSGDILILERYNNGILADRWLGHKREKVDVDFILTGEEIRIKRLG